MGVAFSLHARGCRASGYRDRFSVINAFRLRLTAYVALLAALPSAAASAPAKAVSAEQRSFFETKIRPVLVAHCYKCHSAESQVLEGGLRLDVKEGWQTGGDSGEPAIVPGKSDESRLIRAIRHEADESPMPPKQAKLPDQVISDLIEWVNQGAPDPREGRLDTSSEGLDWEAVYRERLEWWSLQPLAKASPPPVQRQAWVRNDVDPFILAALEAKGLEPAPEADRRRARSPTQLRANRSAARARTVESIPIRYFGRRRRRIRAVLVG